MEKIQVTGLDKLETAPTFPRTLQVWSSVQSKILAKDHEIFTSPQFYSLFKSFCVYVCVEGGVEGEGGG